MKSITELLSKMTSKESQLFKISVYGDGSGRITYTDNGVEVKVSSWHNKEKMNNELNKLDKEYSNQENKEWQL